MNIGILKIGGRLTWDSLDKTGGVGEAKRICELLAPHNIINVYTKILDRESKNPVENIFLHDLKEIDDIKDDIIIIFNGNVNFFGGHEDAEQIKNYILLNKFKGNVFYILIDPELYLKQIWKSMEKKEWSKKYSKEDIKIKRRDIKIITSIYNKRSLASKIEKGKVPIKNTSYFPFQKYPLLSKGLSISNDIDYDLMYMGTFRSGRREDKMIKFYFGHNDIKSTFIGKTKLQHFKKYYTSPTPEFLKSVFFDDIKYHINKSIAHVNIGDKGYEGTIFTPRIYECINYSTVSLIDWEMDKSKEIFKMSKELQDFNYVSTKKDVEEKVLKLKNDNDFRNHIIELQHRSTFFNMNEYYNDLMECISK